MLAQVTGVWASDRRKADGQYFIIGADGSEFIVSNGKGIYRTGQQIIASRLVVVGHCPPEAGNEGKY